MEKRERVLSIRGLDISFQTTGGDVHAIRGVDLDLYRGETVAIVGESGSGKSVSMKAVMGILDKNSVINSGEILFTYEEHGKPKTVDILKMERKAIRRTINGQHIAMVFQDPMTSLDPTMTVGNQIIEGMLLHEPISKKAAWERAIGLLNMVGIPEPERRMKNYPHQLSGGMRQRVVIAIALACDPGRAHLR